MDDDKGVGGAVEKGFSTDLVTDKAIRWIKERDRTKPFSVFLHFILRMLFFCAENQVFFISDYIEVFLLKFICYKTEFVVCWA